MEPVTDHFFAGGDQLFHHIGKIEVFPVGDIGKDLRLEHINPHADGVLIDRLFDVAFHFVVAVPLEDPQVDLRLPLMDGDCRGGFLLLVKADQLAQAQGGEHVAVGHQERLVQAVDQGDRPGGSKRTVFVAVGNVDAELTAVLEEGAQKFGQMSHGKDDMVDPGHFHLPQKDFQNGHVPYGHQRFGKNFCVRREACAFSACQDYGFHTFPSLL